MGTGVPFILRCLPIMVMAKAERVKELLASTKVLLHPEEYAIVSIPIEDESRAREIARDLQAFSSITYDYAEVSLVTEVNEWDGLKAGLSSYEEEGPYRLITFDIVLDLSIVGFLAEVSARLAEAGISIYALSTFLRDHILVKSEDAEKAMKVLERLVESAKRP